jgi:hypothetical protein
VWFCQKVADKYEVGPERALELSFMFLCRQAMTQELALLFGIPREAEVRCPGFEPKSGWWRHG